MNGSVIIFKLHSLVLLGSAVGAPKKMLCNIMVFPEVNMTIHLMPLGREISKFPLPNSIIIPVGSSHTKENFPCHQDNVLE